MPQTRTLFPVTYRQMLAIRGNPDRMDLADILEGQNRVLLGWVDYVNIVWKLPIACREQQTFAVGQKVYEPRLEPS